MRSLRPLARPRRPIAEPFAVQRRRWECPRLMGSGRSAPARQRGPHQDSRATICELRLSIRPDDLTALSGGGGESVRLVVGVILDFVVPP